MPSRHSPSSPFGSDSQISLHSGHTGNFSGAREGTQTLPQRAMTGVPITIGRANDATLVVTDDYASSRHARLYAQDGQWIVEDLGSTNGTYLGRTKVSRPMPVPPGVPVRIGKTVIELRK